MTLQHDIAMIMVCFEYHSFQFLHVLRLAEQARFNCNHSVVLESYA